MQNFQKDKNNSSSSSSSSIQLFLKEKEMKELKKNAKIM